MIREDSRETITSADYAAWLESFRVGDGVRRCRHCGVRFFYIHRAEGTDHCQWCEEQARAGRMVNGDGLADAGGWLLHVVEETDPVKLWPSRQKRRRCPGCGKPINARSPWCGSCSQRRRWAREKRKKRARKSRRPIPAAHVLKGKGENCAPSLRC